MDENVKIKIQERDNTSPAGNGIDSTDIAYIPGFSCLATAPKNVPTLITNTRDFERIFGVEPRKLTTRDVVKYPNLGFISGDPDRSYVFAKELLFQGMPIVYANIGTETYFNKNTFFTTKKPEGSDTAVIDVVDDNLSIRPNPPVAAEYSIDSKSKAYNGIILTPTDKAEFPLVETSRILVKDYKVSLKGNSITTFECQVRKADGTIVECYIKESDDYPFDTNKVEVYSDTYIGILNTDAAKDFYVNLVIDIPVNFNTVEESCTLELFEVDPEVSILDAFYGETVDGKKAPIFDQFEGEELICDKSIYSVKYITSGGYPSIVKASVTEGNKTTEVVKSIFAAEMIKCAETRGDAVALIDFYQNSEDRPFGTDGKSFYEQIHSVVEGFSCKREFGAAMYPWATYNCGTTLKDNPVVSMPASFAYLMCMAKAIKTSPNWLAMAGVSRGLVPAINTLLVPNNVISNNYAEQMQPKFGVDKHNISVNTITNIRPYGLTLWGNRTLKPVDNEGTVALNFLNTRNMLSDIKKLLYTTAKSCMFEQNSTDLWLKFKNGIEPLLRRLKAGNGISEYQIVRGTTKYNGDPLNKGEIAAVIKIVPMYAVEYFELTVEINDQDITVS